MHSKFVQAKNVLNLLYWVFFKMAHPQHIELEEWVLGYMLRVMPWLTLYMLATKFGLFSLF